MSRTEQGALARGLARSMTGFGAARCEGKGLTVDVEIRSVNHRFLQLKTRLPAYLASLESEVERLVRGRLARGAATIRLEASRAGGHAARLDADAFHEYARRLEALAAELGLDERPGLSVLAGLPGVFQEASGPDAREVAPLAKRALQDALEALDAMRLREGAVLARDLKRRHKALGSLVGRIRKRAPASLAAAQTRLRERVAALLEGQARDALSGADLSRELALLADRGDISEELTRLASHLDQWARIAAQGGEIGKPLDFLLQEVAREVNTIGSKAQDVEIAHLVVAMKAELEKAREQAQNLE